MGAGESQVASRYNYDIGNLFGRYCLIVSGVKKSKRLYRIIRSGLKSRLWSEIPLIYESVYRPNKHDKAEDIVFVVLDENINECTRIVRVRVKDIELVDMKDELL